MEGACSPQQIVPEASSENQPSTILKNNLGQTQVSKKPRGRPKKVDSDGAPKKGRGRPKKVDSSDTTVVQRSAAIEILAESLRKAGETLTPDDFPEGDLQFSLPDGPSTSGGTIPKAKRPRGRPRKHPAVPKTVPPQGAPGQKRGRGRPRKTPTESNSVALPSKRELEEATMEQPEQTKMLKICTEETGSEEVQV